MSYIASFYLLHQPDFECGYLYGRKFYIIRFDSEFESIVVKGLTEENRSGFITDFGEYALSRLMELYKPNEGYFIFNANDKLFMTSIVKDKLFVKEITDDDLTNLSE